MSLQFKLTQKELPMFREHLLKEQGNKCSICNISFVSGDQKPCLDHDHKTGLIRDVLCMNCNGIEGKIFNLARRGKRIYTETIFLEKILAYWRKHSEKKRLEIHPLHRTANEKRLARNKKARKKRAAEKK